MSRTPVSRQQRGGGGGDGSFFTFFNKPIGDVPDTKWRELMDDQDYDALIIDIREEIMAQVAAECHQKHIKRQVHKFLVECTHKAFQQLVPLHFYTYDNSHKLLSCEESWMPDDEPLTCKPDSWAKGNIPYNTDDVPKHKYQQTVSATSEYHLVRCDEYPSSHVFDAPSANGELSASDEQVSGELDEGTTEPDEAELPPTNVNVQFDQYEANASAEMLPSFHDIQPNRVASENTFYKIMKMDNKTSNISLQSTKTKKAHAPAWTTLDEIRDELKTRAYGPNRYLQMRCECLSTVDRRPVTKK